MSKFQINLPKTAFSMKANLPTREPEILKFWEKINLYQELRNSRKDKEKFIEDNMIGILSINRKKAINRVFIESSKFLSFINKI